MHTLLIFTLSSHSSFTLSSLCHHFVITHLHLFPCFFRAFFQLSSIRSKFFLNSVLISAGNFWWTAICDENFTSAPLSPLCLMCLLSVSCVILYDLNLLCFSVFHLDFVAAFPLVFGGSISVERCFLSFRCYLLVPL